MLGVDPNSTQSGGIRAVTEVYRQAGFFERWRVRYVATVAAGGTMRKLMFACRGLLMFIAALLRGRVALVHAHMSSRASFWRKAIFVGVGLAAGKPVIVHLHASEFDAFYERECGHLGRAAVRFVLGRATRVVVLSRHWKEYIEGIAPRARVAIIYNAVQMPAEDARPSDPCSLLFLGRLGARKGVFDLLRAMAILRGRFPGIRLMCAGDGDPSGVRRQIRALAIEENVELAGWVAGARKEQLLKRAAVYVLPSYAEGLPMSILEAMSYGLPVVSTTVGGIPEAIDDGINGFLVAPGDIDTLVDRIARLLDNPELRRRCGAAAREKANRCFNVPAVLARLDALYRELGAAPCAVRQDIDAAAPQSPTLRHPQ